MTDEKQQYDEYVQLFHRSENPNEIINGLLTLREWQAAGSLSKLQRLEAQIPAFNTLNNLLRKEQINEIEKIILEYLLPDCLLFDEPSRYLISKHRDILNKWLDDLNDIERDRIRSKILVSVLPLLKSSEPRSACWVISSIGYRDAVVVQGGITEVV